MKAVLISLKPIWCKRIAEGIKTVEVRKKRPKLDVPFKSYIYCTMGKLPKYIYNENLEKESIYAKHPDIINGKVIGEFVCDRIVDIPYSQYFVDYYHTMPQDDLEATCLCMGHIDEYLLNKNGYGWHISSLVIYDKPKELSEFEFPRDYIYQSYRKRDKHFKGITRPPQSWCYVEELRK